MEIINLLDPSIVVAVSKAAICSTDTGSTQCVVPGTLRALDGLKQVITVLVTADEKSGPGSLFSIVLQPCKVFVGLGIMWSLAPLLTTNIDNIKNEFSKILTMFVLAVLLMGNGDVARGLGIANYATLKGINRAISTGISNVANMPDVIKSIASDKAAGQELNDKLKICQSIPATEVAEGGTTPSTKPNPAFETCKKELISMVREKAASNPALAPGLNQFLNQLSSRAATAKEAANNYSKLAGFTGYLENVQTSTDTASLDLTRAIFEGWKTAGFLSLDFALVISIMVLPIFLSASLLSTSPLVAWFSAFWGIGIYQITMIIISDSFLIVESVSGPSLSLFTSSIAVAVVAPTIASAIAISGAYGIYQSLQTVVSTTNSGGASSPEVGRAGAAPTGKGPSF